MSLLERIVRYLEETGVPPSRFGRRAVGDPRLVHDLRRGRRAGRAVIARVESFILRGRR